MERSCFLSYEPQKAIFKNLSFITRTRLAKKKKLAQTLNRILPYKFGTVATYYSSSRRPENAIEIQLDHKEKNFQSLVWVFSGNSLRLHLKTGAWKFTELCKEYIVEDSQRYLFELMTFYFDRKGTAVSKWKLYDNIPEFQFKNPILIGSVSFGFDNAPKDFEDVPFLNGIIQPVRKVVLREISWTDVNHDLIIQAKELELRYMMTSACDTLARFNAIKIYFRTNGFLLDFLIRDEKITLIIRQNRTIGFQCSIRSRMCFETLSEKLSALINVQWERKWFNNQRCISWEREKDEINVYTKQTPDGHMTFLEITEKGFAKVHNFSPKKQLSENVVRSIIANLKWSKKHELALYLDHHSTVFDDLMLVNKASIVRKGYKSEVIVDGETIKIRKDRIHRMRIKELTIENTPIEMFTLFKVDHLILKSDAPFSESFFYNRNFYESKIRKVTATRKRTLANASNLKQNAGSITYLNSFRVVRHLKKAVTRLGKWFGCGGSMAADSRSRESLDSLRLPTIARRFGTRHF